MLYKRKVLDALCADMLFIGNRGRACPW